MVTTVSKLIISPNDFNIGNLPHHKNRLDICSQVDGVKERDIKIKVDVLLLYSLLVLEEVIIKETDLRSSSSRSIEESLDKVIV